MKVHLHYYLIPVMKLMSEIAFVLDYALEKGAIGFHLLKKQKTPTLVYP